MTTNITYVGRSDMGVRVISRAEAEKRDFINRTRQIGAQGVALYEGEPIHIIDTSIGPDSNVQYLIHHGGPKWVEEADLLDIQWVV